LVPTGRATVKTLEVKFALIGRHELIDDRATALRHLKIVPKNKQDLRTTPTL
jgi:hypothetical protein